MAAEQVQQKRQSIRLKEYDYTQEGAYFVTIVTHKRQPLFGEVRDGEMMLNDLGKIVMDVWNEIPRHFPNVELDAFVVMPNHVHGVFMIIEEASHADRIVGATHASPLRDHTSHRRNISESIPRPNGPKRGSVGAIVGSFKSAASRRINARRGNAGPLWQRNYYEHVIRNDDLTRVRAYIDGNPARWAEDTENPTCCKPVGGLP